MSPRTDPVPQNRIWLPAIPIPFDRGLLGYQCNDCGDRFRGLARSSGFHHYQVHWLQEHSSRGRDGLVGTAPSNEPQAGIELNDPALYAYLESGLWTRAELGLTEIPDTPAERPVHPPFPMI